VRELAETKNQQDGRFSHT